MLLGTLFLAGAGVWAVLGTPLDAIPDLSDTQVIVYTEYPGQAPQVVEDQVTYPLTTALLAVPRSKVVRGFSFFGVSFVYVVFEDGTDLYWARSRVLEYLNFAQRRLPAGVTPSLGPDATGVGWVYQYAVLGAQRTLAELRSLQDWSIRYALATADGVAEVASVGGFVKQYQVVVDPRKLQAYGIPLGQGHRGDPRQQHRRRRPHRRDDRDRVRRARPRLPARHPGPRADRAQGRPAARRCCCGTWRGSSSGPTSGAASPSSNGEGEVVSGIALQRDGANALDVIQQRQGQDRRRSRRACPKGCRSPRSTTAPT